MTRRILGSIAVGLAVLSGSSLSAADTAAPATIKLEQIISREDPAFNCLDSALTIGRDGMVYLTSAGHDGGYILRVSRDGRDKLGGKTDEAINNATADANGLIASAHGHFAHEVALADKQFHKLGAVTDFLVSDQVGWDAPAGVEASAGGDFYALDQHRDRILRINADGKIVKAFALPHRDKNPPDGLRVCEKQQSIYVLFRNNSELNCLGFDGALKWQRSIGAGVSPAYGDDGGFDVDDDGVTYAISSRDNVIRRFDAAGNPAGQVKLNLPAERKASFAIHNMRIWQGEAFIRFRDPRVLFEVYDLASGDFRRAVSIDHERLTVSLPSGAWTAGSRVDFKIEFDSGPRRIKPIWRVWARPFGALDYRELTVADGKLQVPADFAGLYQLKVTPEVTPWQQGIGTSEYKVSKLVEVRSPGAVGSVAAATAGNRVWFGRGEEIPFSILLRATKLPQNAEVSVTLTDGHTVFAQTKARLTDGSSDVKLLVPGWLTARLRPGKYEIALAAQGLTHISQPLRIGTGPSDPPFFTVLYGDYRPMYPEASPWDAPDIVDAAVERNQKLDFNLLVDRLGHSTEMDAVLGRSWRAQIDAAYTAFKADPSAPADKLLMLPPAVQAIAGYGATGANQMAILMGNDAGLPLGGPGFDERKPDQDVKDLTTVTETLKGFPGFRGWSWSSNWWVFGNRDAEAGQTPQEKEAYKAAKQRALHTGAWDPILDRVADHRLGYAVSAQALFNEKLKQLAPHEVTAVACPFRNVESYPPISLSNVDETDMQAQWEQIALPLHGPLNVDFYKRPGKRAWGHPEVWNDAGTGEQILPVLWQMVMRGVDGVGCSGPVPPWHFALKGNTDDPRSSWNGTNTVYRNFNRVLRKYGPWLASLHKRDSVAIVASGRMFKIDDWTNVMGRQFARVMEAYISCLYAHRPASIVFAEDMKAGTLKPYQAVLVVGQTVEMEPALATALTAAQEAGVAIFADGTCRAELVKDFAPLGISFDHVERDPSPAADDHAYWRFAEYAQAGAAAVNKALAHVEPVAQIENPEVLLTERRAEDGRYLFVVNNALPGELDPGYLWRVSLASSSLVPQVVPVKLGSALTHLADSAGPAVYDVFAGRQIPVEADGTIQADCRSTVARIFAIFPRAIARVQVSGPTQAAAGDALRWEVAVQDADGRRIAAAVPVRIRLLDHDGNLLDERYGSAGSKGASGEFVLPYEASGRRLTLEATELLSGKSARLTVPVAESKFVPLDLVASGAPPAPAKPTTTFADSADAARDFSPADNSFGPHVRDLVITGGDKLAVLNTMNWDHNLYGVDLETGKTQWRQKVGHYFAFEPFALSSGAAVQGFDLKSAQGYHLYLVGADGQLQRRFALYGLPQRLPHRFVPPLFRDHVDSFAVGDDGRWVATAGDLGLAVWSSDGKVLWQQDWYKHDRHSGKVVALDAETLLVIEGLSATAYHARDGQKQWQLSLGRSGEVRVARVSADQTTCVLTSTTDGGRLIVIRDGRIAREIPTAAEDIGVSADGERIAVVTENLLKFYSVTDGLQWVLHGDDLLHFPRFSGDGRLTTTSNLGTVYVTDLTGKTVFERDLGALAVPAWLADGSLVLATWEGTVSRLDKKYVQQWRTKLHPAATDMRGKLLADDGAPTSQITGWENSTPKPADLAANLLAQTTAMFRLTGSFGSEDLVESAQQKTSMLYDGKAVPPVQPWIPWHQIGTFAETSPINYLLIDAFRTQMKVSGVTLVEDPNYPESWLRDATIEYWNGADERWIPIQPLLSNSAVHTHMFAQPVAAARFRLKLPWGVCGNLRLAQIVFHGEPAGCSHPDVVAKRPLAVLFDEQENFKDELSGNVKFSLEGAYSGGRCLVVTPPAGGNVTVGPPFRPPFGEAIRDWDFEIVEKPQPGQYRYLQFAWKATSPQTRGITLRVSESNYGGYSFAAGESSPFEGATVTKQTDSPSAKWQVVRVDLWALSKKPFRIRTLGLGAKGGAAAFDQIVLGRTEADLPKK